MSKSSYLQGDREAAFESIEAAVRDAPGQSFTGAFNLGLLALVSPDSSTRKRALREADALLPDGLPAQRLWFYPLAIWACVEGKDWFEAERYARELEEFTQQEPLPLSDFYIDYGRTLAAFGRHGRDDAVQKRLRRLREEAERIGLRVLIPELDKALSPT